MDLSNPWSLLSGLLIGAVGLGLFMYGRKACDLKCLGAGIAMNVFPFFVHSVLLMWLIAGACGAGLYLTREGAP